MEKRKRRGFTLIEMMIVVLVITVLVSIVAMQTRRANVRAKEGTLRAGLKSLHDALQMFENEVGGFPATLDELVAPDSSTVSGGPDGGGGVRSPALYAGPYMRQIPLDPWTNTTNWDYTAATGRVHTTSSQTDSSGNPYSSW